jgi:hypothetical protein
MPMMAPPLLVSLLCCSKLRFRYLTTRTITDMVEWRRMSDCQHPIRGDLYLYLDTEGQYGVGFYEGKDYFFNPGAGEVRVVWWAEFNRVDETTTG